MDANGFFDRVNESATWLQEKIPFKPEAVVVLSGGLSKFIDPLTDRIEISSADIPHFPKAKAEGHSGKIIFGKLGKARLAVLQGRFHYYEGHTPQAVVFPYFVFNKIGAKYFVTTNAVGGINKKFKPGDIMMIRDHINYMGINPLIGIAVQRPTDQFTSLTDAYSSELRKIAKRSAKVAGVDLKEGVFIATSGPSYESKAEISAFRQWGADAVGMSTVPEVIAVNFMGAKVASFSCIANPASDLHEGTMTHAEVLDAMNKLSGNAVKLLDQFIKDMTAEKLIGL